MPDSNRTARRFVPDLRVSRTLKERLENEGSYAALARAITDANPTFARRRPNADIIDRRKLKLLIEGAADLPLYLSDFAALDRYLEPYGEGLAYLPMFDRPDLLRSLAGSKHIAFLLGAKPEPEGLRVNVDHCDVRAMVEIQGAVNGFASNVRFETRDIEGYDDVEQARQGAARPEWKGLVGDLGPSLISLGSSRAIHATDWILATMFGLDAFADADPETKRRLPFQFLWKAGLSRVLPGPFHSAPPELADESNRDERLTGASAVRIDGQTHFDEVSQKGHGQTYGVCVVQRRRRGQIWIVIAGITGLATYAGAKLLKNINTRLEQQPGGRESQIFVTLIGATLPKRPSRSLESLRNLRHETILWGPRPFPAASVRSA